MGQFEGNVTGKPWKPFMALLTGPCERLYRITEPTFPSICQLLNNYSRIRAKIKHQTQAQHLVRLKIYWAKPLPQKFYWAIPKTKIPLSSWAAHTMHPEQGSKIESGSLLHCAVCFVTVKNIYYSVQQPRIRTPRLAMDVSGLTRLVCLYNTARTLRTVPLKWQTAVVFPIFKKGAQRVRFNYKGHHTPQWSMPECWEDSPSVNQTSDSRGTMYFSSRSWNSSTPMQEC